MKMIVIFLCFLTVCASSPVSSAAAKHHIQKRAVCGSNEHACNDGACVSANQVCDGRLDCKDGSDERGCRHNAMSYIISIEPFNRSISKSSCLKNQWQCRDGICISFDGVCNGVLDCPDSSDEAISLCQTTQPISSIFVVTGDGAQPTLQLAIPPNQVGLPAIEPVQEAPALEPAPVDQSNNNDSEGTNNKLRSCKLVPHPSVIYRCVDSNSNDVQVCGNLVPAGADVRPECARLYYSPISLAPMRCIDGYWDYVARCAPECGRVYPGGSALEEKGLSWHAVVYRKDKKPYQRVCAGSLISNSAIISAAQCFWSSQKELIPASEFAVAVGKTYEQWDATNEEAQTSNVRNILLTPRFRGADVNYQDDIAIVELSEGFVYNARVGPVCIDSNINFDKLQLRAGNIGKVSGWWSEDKSSLVQVRDMPYVDIETCINDTESRHRGYITSDKICAGNQSGPKFCKDDIGAGLAFKYKVRSVNQFYLRGILSMPLNENGCNAMDHVTFTQIIKHKGFIREHWDTILNVDRPVATTPNTPQVTKCHLPPMPNHGKYVTSTSIISMAGDDSYELVTLTVTCNPGYGVLGPSSIKCFNGLWPDKVPQCIQMCPLPSHPSVEYRCLLSGAQVGLRACSDHEPPGTVVSPRCREPHYYSNSPLSFMKCEDHATWNYIARCKPDCGRATPKGHELAVGGSNAKHGELPWHTGIYDKSPKPYLQVCGGSLISNDLIISAAHCFWKQRGPLPASQFAVAVGKLYRPWNDPVDDAQQSDVKRIHLPPRFRGSDANFQDDIAVVVASRAFEYRSYVRPVCLNFETNFENKQLQIINKGKVAGWGLTSQNGKASPVLQVVELPYVEVDTCIAKSPTDFIQFITSDKICAGSNQANTALCRGDSGGGLVFPATDSYIERYYLRGIVSTAPADRDSNECNTAVFTSFTKITQHEDFIVPYLNDY